MSLIYFNHFKQKILLENCRIKLILGLPFGRKDDLINRTRKYTKASTTVLILLFQFGMKPTLSLYPFLLHAFFMSIFASVIGPFGGFFGSSFKPAFKIKDFVSWSYLN